MQKCSMWKLENDNKTLPTKLSPMKGQQKIYNIQDDIKTLLGRDCEVEKIMRFLKGIGMFKEI